MDALLQRDKDWDERRERLLQKKLRDGSVQRRFLFLMSVSHHGHTRVSPAPHPRVTSCVIPA